MTLFPPFLDSYDSKSTIFECSEGCNNKLPQSKPAYIPILKNQHYIITHHWPWFIWMYHGKPWFEICTIGGFMIQYCSSVTSHSRASKHLLVLLIEVAWHPFRLWVFSQCIAGLGWIFVSEMGATPLYLAIILVRENAYSRVGATLHLSITVYIKLYTNHSNSPTMKHWNLYFVSVCITWFYTSMELPECGEQGSVKTRIRYGEVLWS